jgi:hypothetical protein
MYIMLKTSNVKLLNGVSSASANVLLSRQLTGPGTTATISVEQIIVTNLRKLMAAIQTQLTTYIKFLSGDITKLPSNINESVVRSMSSVFYNLRQPNLNASIYEQYRLFANSLIPVLQNVSTKVLEYQNIENQLKVALAKASILDNIKLLQEYVQNLKKNYNIIPDQELSVPKASIKEPYNTYILTFGFPENMLWDPDRLTLVTNILKTKGLL